VCLSQQHLTQEYTIIRNKYDTIFIYCNWVSSRWQWSVDSYKNRKQTDRYIQKKKQYTKQYKKHKVYKIENKHIKQENKTCKEY